MFSDFLHLKYSDSRTLVHIGKSENVYSDGKYSLKITVSNSPNMRPNRDVFTHA